MQQNNKTVVMGCTHPYWSVLQVGSQHFARQFARNGWEVHYFSAPVSLIHLPKFFTAEVKTRFKRSFYRHTIHENGRIHSYVPFSFIAPDGRFLLRSPIVTHNWHKLMIPALKSRLEKFQNKKFSLIYIDNLSYHFLLDELKYQKSVFRVMDMHERFLGWKGEAFKLARKIARQADVTVYSAFGLEDYVGRLNAKETVLVPNGVDFDFFQHQTDFDQKHSILYNIPHPFILYTGMIDSRLDFGLIRSVAEALPDVSFVFLGPVDIPEVLKTMPSNVYFPGSVSHNQIASIIRSASAGMIPFDAGQMEVLQGIRPLKLFEYMACGIPVISARWSEVEKLVSPAWLYENKNEFVALVQRAINKQFNPAAGLNFARQNSWDRSYQVLMNAARNI